MSKTIEVTENLLTVDDEVLVSVIEDLLTMIENIGYEYNMNEELSERVERVLEGNNIEYTVMEDDI